MNIGFTGHRPNKLGGYNWNSPKNKELIKVLYNKIDEIITEDKFENNFHFITGGALGLDQMAFDLVYKMKSNDIHSISTEIAIPFKDQSNVWFDTFTINRYFKQIEQADKVTYVDTVKEYRYQTTSIPIGKYSTQKLQLRNKYIVDNSDILVAVWDGSKSGTGNCVRYAKKLNKNIIVINPNRIVVGCDVE